MKNLTMAAAAMLIAGGVFAQTTVPSSLVQVYDFKASIKNSNVGTKTDRKTNSLYDYKFAENNVLAGYLVVPACTDCSAGDGAAQLYVYRMCDSSKRLYKVSAAFALVDVFATRADTAGTTLGKEAEGFLVIDPMYFQEDMSGFFNQTLDLGNTKFWAAGFGRVSRGKDSTIEIPNEDPCLPPTYETVQGCTTLETLCGQIVGAMEYDFVCAAPYGVLCATVVEGVLTTHNAVASGSWQIRRNARMESVDEDEAESQILDKLSNYTPYNFGND
jgi:hypothetical protein